MVLSEFEVTIIIEIGGNVLTLKFYHKINPIIVKRINYYYNDEMKNHVRITYGLSVYDDLEIKAVVKVLKEHRSNTGRETEEFEEKISKLYAKKYGIMVNSGSSANFLALSILNLPKGSEIITPVLTFSTTVAPLLQHELKPVFVDVEPGKYIINIDQIEKKITKKTKALMIPLLLGNVPDMRKLSKIAKKHNLFLIEDSCDTLGATINGVPTGKYTDISTTSFFGSHIITAGGNGGMLMVNSPKWRNKAKVLRGWGRSSSLFSESEDIRKRFKGKIGSMPYDAKFIFAEVGYNFLPSEMGSAFGNVQLKKLSKFKTIRDRNFRELSNFFRKYKDFFVVPEQTKNTATQWLAFPLTIKDGAPFTRMEITTFLEKNNVQTRPIFTGNITYQPGFKKYFSSYIKEEYPIADEIMKNGFVVGCHHGLSAIHIKRLEELFTEYFNKYIGK